jgi:hypothetical protein
MKINPVLLTCLLLSGVAMAARADIVVNDDFDAGYTVGDLTGQSGTDDMGFSGGFLASSNNGGNGNFSPAQDIVAGGLTYMAGSGATAIDIYGGTQNAAVTVGAGVQFSLGRDFSGTLTGQTYFVRLVYNAAASPPGSYQFLDFSLASTTAINGPSTFGFQAGSDSYANASIETPDGTASTLGEVLPSGTNLLVAEYVWDPTANSDAGGYTTANLYIDPTTTDFADLTPAATVTTTNPATDLGTVFGLGTANAVDTIGVDSLQISTTYEEAVTPEPSSMALIIVGGLGLLGFMIRQRRLRA